MFMIYYATFICNRFSENGVCRLRPIIEFSPDEIFIFRINPFRKKLDAPAAGSAK
jgi:hypothetical protein